VLAAVILTIGVATPAVGVPSISKVYRVAKALRTARTANKGPKVVERQRLDIPAAPNDFAESDIRCPRGYTAVAIGLGLGALDPTFFASYGNGALGSMYNSSDTAVVSGDAFVECVKSRSYTSQSASVPRMRAPTRLGRDFASGRRPPSPPCGASRVPHRGSAPR
jgi:hypothetical protein